MAPSISLGIFFLSLKKQHTDLRERTANPHSITVLREREKIDVASHFETEFPSSPPKSKKSSSQSKENSRLLLERKGRKIFKRYRFHI